MIGNDPGKHVLIPNARQTRITAIGIAIENTALSIAENDVKPVPWQWRNIFDTIHQHTAGYPTTGKIPVAEHRHYTKIRSPSANGKEGGEENRCLLTL